MEEIIRVLKFISAHNHPREGELLKLVVKAERYYSYLVAMGNLSIATSNAGLVWRYVLDIFNAGAKFYIIPTLMLTKETTQATISEAARSGIKAVKFLPGGTSTNSDEGISFFDLLSRRGRKLLAEIEKNSLLLLMHCELVKDKNGRLIDPRERSLRALPFLEILIGDFPNLKIVVEHANDRATIDFVRSARENVWATLRPHDTILVYKDVCDKSGEIINALNYAKPIAKSEDDRLAVLEAMVGGEDEFFYGPDSAPHLLASKIKNKKAGIFLPSFVAIPLVVEIFEQAGALHHLKKFTVDTARRIYSLPEITEELTLKQENWQVPQSYHGIPLFMGGKRLEWKIVE